MRTNTLARMRSGLTVCLVALSLAALPAPRAEAQDAGKVVAGLATLAILGAILSQAQAADHGKRDRVVTRGYAPPPPPVVHKHKPQKKPVARPAPPRHAQVHRPHPRGQWWQHAPRGQQHPRR